MADEGLEVEWFDDSRHVLGRDHSALYDQHVQLTGQDVVQQGTGALRGDRGAGDHASGFDLADSLGDQAGDDGLLVELLHPLGGLLNRLLSDLGQSRVGILVAGPETLKVEYPHATQATDLDGGGRTDHAVHGRCHQRQFEAVSVDLPADVDVLGVPGAPAGDNGDVVESVGASSALAQPDLYLGHGHSPPTEAGSVRSGLSGGPRKGSILATRVKSSRRVRPVVSGSKGKPPEEEVQGFGRGQANSSRRSARRSTWAAVVHVPPTATRRM